MFVIQTKAVVLFSTASTWFQKGNLIREKDSHHCDLTFNLSTPTWQMVSYMLLLLWPTMTGLLLAPTSGTATPHLVGS